MMRYWHKKLTKYFGETADYLQGRLPEQPQAVIVTGSGMKDVFSNAETLWEQEYASVPGLVAPSVIGHGSSIRLLRIGTTPVLWFSGRKHRYERAQPTDIVAPIGVSKMLGIDHVVLTNAAGGLHPDFAVGDIMLIADTINFLRTSLRRGWMYDVPTDYEFPTRYFHKQWGVQTTHTVAEQHGITLQQGVYVALPGPSYETGAEIRMARRMGATAVGMSTAEEAELAATLGMNVLAFSLITNIARETAVAFVSHDEVKDAADKALPCLTRCLTTAIEVAPTQHITDQHKGITHILHEH
jgi:purine-nucleoside phosphorylase